MLRQQAERWFPGLNTAGYTRWMGFRPSMPDSLPVIGRSPRFANVVFAFGHGHLGMVLGPRTGELVAALMAGRDPGIDMTPYRVDRFWYESRRSDAGEPSVPFSGRRARAGIRIGSTGFPRLYQSTP